MTPRRQPHPLPSRRAGHVTSQGQPKRAYRTLTEARAAAQLAWTLNRAELNAYRCALCHQWHIGGERE